MFRGKGRGRGGHGSPIKVPLKGFFDGIWKFHTCQQPQPKRCNFFLWDDEAKPREEAAVLNNSRSEPRSPPATPSRGGRGLAHSPQYEETSSRVRSPSRTASPSPMHASSAMQSKVSAMRSQHHVNDEEEEEFLDWPLSDDDEVHLTEAADRASTSNNSRSARALPPIETPRKSAKTSVYTSPGKRRRSPTDDGDAGSLPTPSTDDPFFTPLSTVSRKNLFAESSEPKTPTKAGSNRFLMSPSLTPTPNRYRDVSVGNGELSGLTADVFKVLDLNSVKLNQEVQEALMQVLNRHTLQTQGVARGRDISRLALKTKDAKISELYNRIAALESASETDAAVIRHLRQENSNLGPGG
ncbi:MAG: hypothetical protein M1836_001349 [Candelina mexicana]|nr:MAG: hypothetical protein M1836_001349 [Candelina mexicana]